MLDWRATRVTSIAVLVASVVACTAQDRYDAVYREHARECDLKVSEAERERCREQLVPASYEEYERQRASVMRSPQPGSARGSPLARKRAGGRSPEQNGGHRLD